MLKHAAFLGLLSAIIAFSQTTTATLDGSVRDQAGALVPGATVTVTNTQTGVVTTKATDEKGNFLVSFLLPGTYDVSAEKTGFKKAVRQDRKSVV